ncbi:MAG: HNH endonuclease [Planctomycetes bacterium]|nr:HNH endonuclease [Planctomycetota bacterium]
MKKIPIIELCIKELLGFDKNDSDAKVIKEWKKASSRVCKPCWELKYCPYGPLVEQFPLLPCTRSQAIEHNEYLEECLRTGILGNGRKLDEVLRKEFEQELDEFDATDYPEQIPQEISEMGCNVFGHICPVVFAAEGFTETSKVRRTGRYIPFKTKVRVVRRDNYTCQHCGKHLKDNEVEFDHAIPISKGGSSEEHNIRLSCFDCNRDKSDRVEI